MHSDLARDASAHALMRVGESIDLLDKQLSIYLCSDPLEAGIRVSGCRRLVESPRYGFAGGHANSG